MLLLKNPLYSSSDSILYGLLEIKKETESKLPRATVLLSTPVYKNRSGAVMKGCCCYKQENSLPWAEHRAQ